MKNAICVSDIGLLLFSSDTCSSLTDKFENYIFVAMQCFAKICIFVRVCEWENKKKEKRR